MTAIVPDSSWRRPSTQESLDSLKRVQNIIGDFDADYTMKYYDEWSQHYEKDLEVIFLQISKTYRKKMITQIAKSGGKKRIERKV